ncbi:TIGR02597 family protein [Puniceicoccaceae bacterium K14]|nr:TIGR02597 family protein [Puniceicoccaceae bacterium K14]
MKAFNYFKFLKFSIVVLGSLTIASYVRSQETEGKVVVEILPHSDAIVSIPFLRTAVVESSVVSIEEDMLTLAEGVLEDRAFNQSSGISRFGLFVESGEFQGRHFDIVSNDSSGIVLANFGDVDLLAGDLVSVRPYWTLGSAFFEGGGMLPTDEIGRRSIELILIESGAGAGLSAKRVYYYYNGGWRKLGRCPKFKYDSVVLETGSAFVLRNNNPISELAEFSGEEAEFPLAEELFVSIDSPIDNFTNSSRGVDVPLASLGLDENIFRETLDPEFPLDLVLVYDNEIAGKNKRPSSSYYYFNDGWRKIGEDVSVNFGTDLIRSGSGFAVRKATGESGYLLWSR